MVNLEPPPSETAPLEIPGFQLFELIGEGGAGKVYRGLQLRLQRTVAVKLLPMVQDQHVAAGFERESRLMASLAHPNLVTVFDCGQVNDHYYIVTELIEGASLRPRINAGEPWPIARACSLIDQVARALSYMHGKGILHLDLKPENILGDDDGKPKITDFGLSLAKVDAQSAADLELAQGSLDYCAPEQRFGLPTSERSDLYSLAVMAYELLTGHLPGRVYESARQLNPALPIEVDGVLRRALARSQEDRYPSVEEFRRELLKALTARSTRSRRWWGLGAALGVCVGTVAFLIGAPLWKFEASSSSGARPVETWIIHDRPEQLQWFDQAEPGGLAFQPLLAQGRMPSGPGAPPLPVWPSTRPVLVISSSNALGFVHPLSDPTFGRRVLRSWEQLLATPPTLDVDNLCRSGHFKGDCLTHDQHDDRRAWRSLVDQSMLRDGNAIGILEPPDRGGNSALLLQRTDAISHDQEFGCYQWLSRIPERAGTVIVMRFRARAEEGDGRIAVRVELPLLLPADAKDDTVERLRSVSAPLTELAHAPGEESRHYKLENWVTPGREWQTYYTIWEWPPYCQDPGYRNLVVFYAGTGKVWIDDLEIFTWELGAVR
jgi:hypothetical protein